MNYEKIIKRPNGTRVKIEICLQVFTSIDWHVHTYYCAPGKRKFLNITVPVISSAEQANRLDVLHKYVTREEIKAAKLELWEQLKPE